MTAPTPHAGPDPAPENPRPYRHLTVDELRQVADLTDDEWLDELRVRGVIVPAYDGPPQEMKPIAYLPGALERFLKERGQPVALGSNINLRPTFAQVDTSAVAAIAFTEPDAADIALRLASYSVLLSAELLEAELRSACARERQSFNPGLLSRVEWILPHRSLRPEMVSALQVGYLRGADLWHIATALYVSRAVPRLDFVTRDRRQRDIANGLGFVT